MDGPTIIKATALILPLIVVPGLALTYAIFPGRKEIDIIERVGISFILGFVPYFLLYFASKNIGLQITSGSTLGAVVLVTAIGYLCGKGKSTK